MRYAPRLSPERFLAHPVRAVWGGTVLVALVGLAAIFIPVGPLAVDSWWSEAMNDLMTPFLKDVALVFNALGKGLWRALTLAAVGLVLLVRRRFIALAAGAAAEILAPLCSSVLKALVDRPRPPGGLVHPVGSSFPSGHATYAGATCVALVLLLSAPGRRRRLWWAAAALGIAGMAWSRTLLQVHWLSDVVAGSMLGVGVTLLVFGAAQLLAQNLSEEASP
jgi:undecaprenyl-diphosphatase